MMPILQRKKKKRVKEGKGGSDSALGAKQARFQCLGHY